MLLPRSRRPRAAKEDSTCFSVWAPLPRTGRLSRLSVARFDYLKDCPLLLHYYVVWTQDTFELTPYWAWVSGAALGLRSSYMGTEFPAQLYGEAMDERSASPLEGALRLAEAMDFAEQLTAEATAALEEWLLLTPLSSVSLYPGRRERRLRRGFSKRCEKFAQAMESF